MAKPTFFIVGAPKCGTTSLDDCLRQHPEIFMAKKEPHFFGSDLHFQTARLSLDEYLALFDRAGGEKHVGESSVYYLISKKAALEIKRFSPDAKIVVMVRNPAELVVSLFRHNRFRLFDDVDDFEESLELEELRKRGEKIPEGVDIVENLLYREVVKFSEQIQRYFDAFGRGNVHVIIFDDFRDSTESVYRDLCAFLGVSTSFVPVFGLHNPERDFHSKRFQALIRSRTKPSVFRIVPGPIRKRIAALNFKKIPGDSADHKIRGKLCGDLALETEKLGSLLGLDLSFWNEADRREDPKDTG